MLLECKAWGATGTMAMLHPAGVEQRRPALCRLCKSARCRKPSQHL